MKVTSRKISHSGVGSNWKLDASAPSLAKIATSRRRERKVTSQINRSRATQEEKRPLTQVLQAVASRLHLCPAVGQPGVSRRDHKN